MCLFVPTVIQWRKSTVTDAVSAGNPPDVGSPGSCTAAGTPSNAYT